MGYVRYKAIKGGLYGYWVESSWTAKGPRQKVKEYLGRIAAPQRSQQKPLTDYIALPYESTLGAISRPQALKMIIRWALCDYGYAEQQRLLNHLDGSVFDLEQMRFVTKEGKKQPLVLRISDGYFCEKTARELLTFKEKGFDRDVGVKLAKAFVLAGIAIPADFFIAYFNRYMEEYVERGD